MNDNELSTMVRESVTDVHSATPIAQIISRGRAVRARRRTPALAGAGAVVAGIALAVTTLVPSGHPGVEGSRHPGNPLANARLAAWTVAKQANGDIDVTINQLKNPVGLQSTLRADGVPVRVSYSSHPFPVTAHRLIPRAPALPFRAFLGRAFLPRPTPQGRPGAPGCHASSTPSTMTF